MPLFTNPTGPAAPSSVASEFGIANMVSMLPRRIAVHELWLDQVFMANPYR